MKNSVLFLFFLFALTISTKSMALSFQSQKFASLRTFSPSAVQGIRVLKASHITSRLEDPADAVYFTASHYLEMFIAGKGYLVFPLGRQIDPQIVQACKEVVYRKGEAWTNWLLGDQFVYDNGAFSYYATIKAYTYKFTKPNSHDIDLVKDVDECRFDL